MIAKLRFSQQMTCRSMTSGLRYDMLGQFVLRRRQIATIRPCWAAMTAFACLALLTATVWAQPRVAAPSPGVGLHDLDRIVPTPQQVSYGDFLPLGVQAGVDALPIYLLLSDEASDLELLAAEQLANKLHLLKQQHNLSLRVAVQTTRRQTAGSPRGLAIVMGQPDTHRLVAQHIDQRGLDLPQQAEGYLITTLMMGEPMPTIVVAGRDVRGTWYGVQSLMQMLTAGQGQLLVRRLDVRDWPAYAIRSLGNDEAIPPAPVPSHAIQWLARFKLNTFAVGQSYHWPSDWRHTPADRLDAARQAGQLAHLGMTDLMFQVHPFGRADDPHAVRAIRMADPQDRQRLVDLCLDMLDAGAVHILLRADDFHALTFTDQQAYESEAAAHVDLIRHLYDKITEAHPHARLTFCPPYYFGQETDDPQRADYLRHLGQHLPESVMLMWTGPQVVSHQFTDQQLTRFAQIIGRPPFLWDNTVFHEHSAFGYRYQYAWYMYHPLTTRYPPSHAQLSPGIRFNYTYDDSQMARAAAIMMAAYLWNPQQYHPQQARYDAISLLAGRDAYEAVMACIEQLQMAWDLRHSPARIVNVPAVPSTQRFADLLGDLTQRTSNQALVDELEQSWWTHAATAKALGQIDEQLQALASKRLAWFDPREPDWHPSTQGDWSVNVDGSVVQLAFPFNTPSQPGSRGQLSRQISVPASPTGRYRLAFLADDDYDAQGQPPIAWPGYFFKQVLIDEQVVWQADVVGPNEFEVILVDVTNQLHGKQSVTLSVRGYDARGVSNLGVNMSFSALMLIP